MRYAIPLVFFALLVGLLWFGLGNDPTKIPSPLVGKPAPAFELPRLYAADQTVSPDDLKGKVWLLNVFASWCVSCRAEHEVVSQFIRQHQVDVLGLNYKDEEADAKVWLQQFGNPYAVIAVDITGRTGIDWGVYGVPETFVMDKQGIIRHKFTGPLTEQAVNETLVPLINTLQQEKAL
ncbi:MAG TPA: DsbE family thiol:disulfide interchange protein [Thiothrix sp.]|nr:DsbE family thiol:disulfide interchange protein [Thiothrix sp.]